MSENGRDVLLQNLDAVSQIIERYPVCIPVSAAAEFLHTKPEALRAAMEQKRCPFGFSWQLGERAAYKIPTLTFVCWLTKGTLAF